MKKKEKKKERKEYRVHTVSRWHPLLPQQQTAWAPTVASKLKCCNSQRAVYSAYK